MRDVLGYPVVRDNTQDLAEGGTRLVSLARLAGLLHDVGHSPFSHVGERRLFKEKDGERRWRHEDYSEAIISSTEIGSIINEELDGYGITSGDVARILVGAPIREGFVSELLSSPWDVDKMDYLLRDSLYCGVQYGRFDLERLIRTLTLFREPGGGSLILAVEEGGLHAVESLILARYFMFTQVYFHDVRRAYDLVLTDLIAEALQKERGEAYYPLPSQIQEFLAWDDVRILAAAQNLSNKEARNPAWSVLVRQHPRVIFSTLPHPGPLVVKNAGRLENTLRANFPEIEKVWTDKAIDHPESYKEVDLPIKRDAKRHGQNPEWTFLRSESRAVASLEPIGQVRVYGEFKGDKALEERAVQFCQEQIGGLR